MTPSSDISLPQALLHSPCPTEDLDPHTSPAGTITTVTVNDKEIDDSITSNKCKIRDILNNVYSNDGSLLIGTLTFAQSKFTSYVLKTFESQYQSDSINHLPNNQENIPATSAGHIVDRVWIEIHHPAIKYFQSKFYALNKDSKRKLSNNKNSGLNKNPIVTVEIKKLFDRFVKFISKSFEFYFFLLKTILNTYDLSVYIPVKKLCSTLKINLDSVTATTDSTLSINSNSLVSSIVYVIHKCVLYIGDLSRYRTLIAKTYLPSTSISKEDNNNYSKSIELYKLSLLILPSLGDPYNHIAIIDNFKDDKFNVVYNFIRSSLTSNPLPIGFTNFLNLLIKQPKHNSILKKFEAQNSLERSTITKNDRLELLKSQFLVLFNYFLLPSKWKLKDGYLVKGYNISEIENDFYKLLGQLDFHKQIFNDFYFKQLVILTGGFEILIDKSMKHPDLDQSANVIGDYLNFIFRYLNTFMKVVLLNWGQDTSNPNVSTSLLPVMRLMLCWLKERELARAYLIQTPNCTMALAEIINCIDRYFKSNPDLIIEINSEELLTEENLFNSKPTRKRLFKEDVTLKEFKPINYFLNDFNDDDLYKKDESAILALIGELPNDSHKNMKLNDNLLRLISIGYLGKSLIMDNSVDVKYDETTKLFNLPSKVSLDLSITVDKPSKLSPYSSPSKLRLQGVNRKRKVFTKKTSPAGLKEDERGYTFENPDKRDYDENHDQIINNNHEIPETDTDVNNTRFVDMVASIVNEENSSSSNSKNFTPPIDLSSTSNQPVNILSNNIWSSSTNNNMNNSNGDLLFQQDLYNQLLNPNNIMTPPANSSSNANLTSNPNPNPNTKQETSYFYPPSQSQSQHPSSGSAQDQYLNYVSQVNTLNSYNLHQLNMNNMNMGNMGNVGNTANASNASNANDPGMNVNMNMNMNMAMNAMMMNMIRSQDASHSSQSSNSAHNHHHQQQQPQTQSQPQTQQPPNGFDKLNDFINGNNNNQGHNSGYSGYGTF